MGRAQRAAPTYSVLSALSCVRNRLMQLRHHPGACPIMLAITSPPHLAGLPPLPPPQTLPSPCSLPENPTGGHRADGLSPWQARAKDFEHH
jgi:hypothetical protein